MYSLSQNGFVAGCIHQFIFISFLVALHNEVQKFSSGTGSPGWSRKNGRKTVVVVVVLAAILAATYRQLPAVLVWSALLVLIAPAHRGMVRLSWPGLLVTYQDTVVTEWSLVSIAVRLSVHIIHVSGMLFPLTLHLLPRWPSLDGV